MLDGRVFGCRGELFCLDAASLKTLWTSDDKAFGDYVSFIGGSDQVLAATVRGELLLLGGQRRSFRVAIEATGFRWRHVFALRRISISVVPTASVLDLGIGPEYEPCSGYMILSSFC